MEAVRVVGATLVLEDEVVPDGTVAFIDGRIVYVGPTERMGDAVRWEDGQAVPLERFDVYDAQGGWLLPGFIDLHVHGGGGGDVMDATRASLERMAHIHALHGTTGFLATTMTAEHKAVVAAAQAVRAAIRVNADSPWNGATLLGLHLEGPYLNPARAGAQDPTLMRSATMEELEELCAILEETFRLVTLAPEIEGGMEALATFSSAGVVVSLGHTDSTFEQAQAAFAAGARHVTHTFNGMRGLHHRDPGIAGAALLYDGALCEVIADGIHLHPDAIRLVYRNKGPDRICLITDGIEATGMPDGVYQLGALPVVVKDGACRLESGSLAGSILTMDRALAFVVREVGVPIHHAARMAALNPARQLRMADRKGSLRVGKDADLVLLDGDYSAVQTWIAGRPVTPKAPQPANG